jgi:hypothetical protein
VVWLLFLQEQIKVIIIIIIERIYVFGAALGDTKAQV